MKGFFPQEGNGFFPESSNLLPCPMPGIFFISKSRSNPARCIVPIGIENLLVAGRPISATHEAFSSSRINGTCIAIGEVCGIAAALAKGNWNTQKINVADLQSEAMAQHGVVHRRPC